MPALSRGRRDDHELRTTSRAASTNRVRHFERSTCRYISNRYSLAVVMPNARRERRGHGGYFKPSFLPAASSEIDSRMRLTRVSGRFAI
jgi:hypothetical protein